MKIWYSTSTIAPIISFGRSQNIAGEDFIIVSMNPDWELDPEFYEDVDPAAPVLVRKSDTAIQAIKDARVTDETSARSARNILRSTLENDRLNGVTNPAQSIRNILKLLKHDGKLDME